MKFLSRNVGIDTDVGGPTDPDVATGRCGCGLDGGGGGGGGGGGAALSATSSSAGGTVPIAISRSSVMNPWRSNRIRDAVRPSFTVATPSASVVACSPPPPSTVTWTPGIGVPLISCTIQRVEVARGCTGRRVHPVLANAWLAVTPAALITSP